MRSACLGARSARSLITTRPWAVSRKIVFCGSRPVGRLCAKAAVAHTSATNATNKPLMSAPGSARAGLVSRFRSSPEFAARSEANFGIEGHQQHYDSSAALNPKFATGLAAVEYELRVRGASVQPL